MWIALNMDQNDGLRNHAHNETRINWFGSAQRHTRIRRRNLQFASGEPMPANPSSWPPRLVTVPGLHGSEDTHWQTWLERQYSRSLRVEQKDWAAPELDEWSRTVSQVFDGAPTACVVAAHSFGCLATVQALARHPGNVVGVLLVAPASPGKFNIEQALNGNRLPVPSIVVASESDPWVTIHEARKLASNWGSTFVNLGDAGHINVASGHGPLPRAKHLVDLLVHSAASVRFREPETFPHS
jgi:predicted alpha/beta hydrolase family esterase